MVMHTTIGRVYRAQRYAGDRREASLLWWRTVGVIVPFALAILVAPLATYAQPLLPVIGYLSQRSPLDSASIVAAFRQGLKEEGFVEGQNVAIEFRFADGQIDRVPALASDLVGRGVNVFV